MSDIFQGPGLAIISRADNDGWPIGDPESYVGPFDTYEDYQKWASETPQWCKHVHWRQLTLPPSERRHKIKVMSDGFVIMHPLSCRPNLFECKYNDKPNFAFWQGDAGVYFCKVDDNGELVIEEAV